MRIPCIIVALKKSWNNKNKKFDMIILKFHVSVFFIHTARNDIRKRAFLKLCLTYITYNYCKIYSDNKKGEKNPEHRSLKTVQWGSQHETDRTELFKHSGIFGYLGELCCCLGGHSK